MFLFENQTENGDSTIFSISNRNGLGMDGKYVVWVYGTWDGAAVTAHYSFDSGVNWSAIDTDATFTQNKGIKFVPENNDCFLKLTLSLAGASTDISAVIK